MSDSTGTETTAPTRLFDVTQIKNVRRVPLAIDVADISNGQKFFDKSGRIMLNPDETITVRTIRLNSGQIRNYRKAEFIKTLELVREGLA